MLAPGLNPQLKQRRRVDGWIGDPFATARARGRAAPSTSTRLSGTCGPGTWGVHEWANAKSGSIYHALTNIETWGPVGEVIGLWIHTADSRTAWTHRLIRRLEKGTHRMAGEN